MSGSELMTGYMLPFTRHVDLQSGTIAGARAITERYLTDLKGFFADPAAEQALLADNPLIYQVYEATSTPETAGHLLYSTTVIRPGKVGDEYFMTRGHYHALADRAEVYFGLAGEGCLLLQNPNGEVNVQTMTAGVAAYVPPYWGHRTINVGAENFAFLAVYPAEAGHNYGIIADQGFASIMIERDGRPQLVPNPRYRPS
jgi:glucose-6-phosphate isomerase